MFPLSESLGTDTVGMAQIYCSLCGRTEFTTPNSGQVFQKLAACYTAMGPQLTHQTQPVSARMWCHLSRPKTIPLQVLFFRDRKSRWWFVQVAKWNGKHTKFRCNMVWTGRLHVQVLPCCCTININDTCITFCEAWRKAQKLGLCTARLLMPV